MIGTVVSIVRDRPQRGQVYGFIVEDGKIGEDREERNYFDARGCLCDFADVFALPGARVSFELKTAGEAKPFAVNVRALAPNIEKGIITTYRDTEEQKFGFVKDGWGDDYFFAPFLTENFSELRVGQHVSFEVSRRKDKPAARNLSVIK